jgi:hypothetical protein
MEFLGCHISATALISGGISIVVGIGGFVIGMRVAKERADRSVLRKHYQDLYAHFRDMKDAAERGTPKEWGDFPLKGNQYLPLTRAGNATVASACCRNDLQRNSLRSRHWL